MHANIAFIGQIMTHGLTGLWALSLYSYFFFSNKSFFVYLLFVQRRLGVARKPKKNPTEPGSGRVDGPHGNRPGHRLPHPEISNPFHTAWAWPQVRKPFHTAELGLACRAVPARPRRDAHASNSKPAGPDIVRLIN